MEITYNRGGCKIKLKCITERVDSFKKAVDKAIQEFEDSEYSDISFDSIIPVVTNGVVHYSVTIRGKESKTNSVWINEVKSGNYI